MAEIREYSEEMLTEVFEMARKKMSVSDIASSFKLTGWQRHLFIKDIKDSKTELSSVYVHGLMDAGVDDSFIEIALQNASLHGDVDAAEFLYRYKRQAEIDVMKKELFGI